MHARDVASAAAGSLSLKSGIRSYSNPIGYSPDPDVAANRAGYHSERICSRTATLVGAEDSHRETGIISARQELNEHCPLKHRAGSRIASLRVNPDTHPVQARRDTGPSRQCAGDVQEVVESA